MSERRATSQFRHIADLLDRMEASDGDGRSLALDEAAEAAVRTFLTARDHGHKILLIGNGGSASIAGHMQMDLCNRVGARATVFHDPPVLTALANDHGYPTAFERLVGLWAERHDCLVAISSSGQSDNILRGVAMARASGVGVITLSGFAANNPLRRLGELNFYVPALAYGDVEVAHHALGHFLTDRAAELSKRP